MATLLQDLRLGLRLLRRSPGFTGIAVAALAIGIGANTAIFSVVNTLLLKRLPYKDPDRLAIVWEHNLPRDRKNNVVSPGNFLHWRDMNQTFEDMAAVGMTFTLTLTGFGDPEELQMQYVSAAFFPIVGVAPQIGRPITAEEDTPNAPNVVVISDRLWKRRLQGDPGILEHPIQLQGRTVTVVGVMPPGFSFLDKTVDLWVPVRFSQQARTPRGRWTMVVARLKPGVTFARAQDDMTRVAAELTRMFPDFDTGWTARVVPLREQLTGDVRSALVVLLGAVGFVLLIACANVGNLLLARATARQRELAVRAALGAGRRRLVRQLLAESAVLAALGGAAGLLLAWWAVYLLRVVVAERLQIPRLEFVGIDGWVLAFTAAASILSGTFFGLVPALSASHGALSDALKEGGRTGSSGRATRTRSTFVVVEVGLAVVLLVGAGLLVRSFVRLMDVDPGFDRARTVTMRVTLPTARYNDNAKSIQFFERLFARIDATPGVVAAGATSFLPIAGLGAATGFSVVGRPLPPRGQEPVTDVRVVTNNYFKAMGIPLLKGRLFDEHDPSDARGRVIVNETMARRHWPGEDPIGKKIRVNWSDDQDDEIIGVVGDVHQTSLDTEPRETNYWPYARSVYTGMTLAVRTSGDPAPVVKAIVGLVHEQDPLLAVASIRTLDEVVSRSVAERRVTMLLLTVFAGAALLLAAVGIYGVIAYTVTQRTQEIGIRLALGAQSGHVLGMVIGQAMALALVGIVLGGLAAMLLTKLMSGLLFGVKPADPVTFLAAAAMLAVIAGVASFIPGRRATRVDPAIALRAE
jgi:putative ABC transport system permease protein